MTRAWKYVPLFLHYMTWEPYLTLPNSFLFLLCTSHHRKFPLNGDFCSVSVFSHTQQVKSSSLGRATPPRRAGKKWFPWIPRSSANDWRLPFFWYHLPDPYHRKGAALLSHCLFLSNIAYMVWDASVQTHLAFFSLFPLFAYRAAIVLSISKCALFPPNWFLLSFSVCAGRMYDLDCSHYFFWCVLCLEDPTFFSKEDVYFY